MKIKNSLQNQLLINKIMKIFTSILPLKETICKLIRQIIITNKFWEKEVRMGE